MTTTAVSDKSELIEFPPLTTADRCDKCGAQAKMRAILEAGDLLFCGHHGAANLPKLVEIAIDVRVTDPLD